MLRVLSNVIGIGNLPPSGTQFFIISYVFVIFRNNFIKPGAGGVLVGDRNTY